MKEEAIKFGKWIQDNCIQAVPAFGFMYKGDEYTIEELYNFFKFDELQELKK